MNKLYIISLILGFWLVFPLPFVWLEMANADSATMINLKNSLNTISAPTPETSNTSDFWQSIGNFFRNIGNLLYVCITIIGLYFSIMLFNLNAPIFINYFLWFLRIISASTLFLLLRGN